jgi:hypothetical protein
VAGAVDEEHFGAAAQLAREGADLVEQVAAGAMDEDQRRQVCISGRSTWTAFMR